LIAFFLAAGLNPAVLFLQRRGLTRGRSVTVIIFIALLFFALLFGLVIPPAVTQISNFIKSLPVLVQDLARNHYLNSLNNKYGILNSLEKSVKNLSSNTAFFSHAFGGVVGVGKAVVSLTVSVIILIILTLYFLVALPKVTLACYSLIPSSRRDRVSKLSDEIIFRIGAFVGGQATVALIAGVFGVTSSLILRIPYAAALGMIVFVCGLIPLIGHPMGILILTSVALTKSPLSALIIFILYLAYVQIENYFILPKVMSKSLSIPGIVTIIAAMLGTSLLGPIGGLLSVPIAAAVLLIIDEVILPKSANS
jgi:predicted PurR-regulated permease PerM